MPIPPLRRGRRLPQPLRKMSSWQAFRSRNRDMTRVGALHTGRRWSVSNPSPRPTQLGSVRIRGLATGQVASARCTGVPSRMSPPQSLAELEQKLAAELASRDVVLLSEIELSDADVLWIAREVAKRAATDINLATDDLWRRFPVTMALLLVWIGVYGYQQGDFWELLASLRRYRRGTPPFGPGSSGSSWSSGASEPSQSPTRTGI